MKCPVCGNEGKKVFDALLLNKYTADYFACDVCACVFTETPYWVEESYEDSITAIDTGIMNRNISFAMDTNYILHHYFDTSGKFIDYAGGYGIFTRLMRDLGYDFYWSDKYSPNLLARGYEASTLKEKVELVTSFEAFEHFANPMEEIRSLCAYGSNILFSTLIYDTGRSIQPKDWWYYVFETGQHITFYSEITLHYIASQLGLHYVKISPELHLFTQKDIGSRKLQKLNRPWGRLQKLLLFYRNRRHGKSEEDMYTQKAKRFS